MKANIGVYAEYKDSGIVSSLIWLTELELG